MKRAPKALLCAALIACLPIVLVASCQGGGRGGSVTITLGGPHGTPQQQVSVPKSAAVAAAAGLRDEQLRSEVRGLTPDQLDSAREQQEKMAVSSGLPNVTPDAAPEQRGCRTQLVQNYSSRRGVPPREFVFHYTVSRNIPNSWDDVYAIARLFDNAAFQASSNYIVDAEGHCLYIVRESDKAWTQAAANPFSISVEAIGMGSEPSYLGGTSSAGFRKVVLVLHDAAKRWQIPLQLGVVRNCLVARAGVLDHNALGPCGGGHHDITPYSVEPLIAAARVLEQPLVPPPLPPPVKTHRCSVRNIQRKLDHGLKVDGVYGASTRAAVRRFQRRRHLAADGVVGRKTGSALGLAGCH